MVKRKVESFNFTHTWLEIANEFLILQNIMKVLCSQPTEKFLSQLARPIKECSVMRKILRSYYIILGVNMELKVEGKLKYLGLTRFRAIL